MLDEFYPADEMGHHVIDQNGIAKTVLPFIKSLQESYSRIYPNNKEWAKSLPVHYEGYNLIVFRILV